MGDRIERYPIFPLPMVVLPSEPAPLHIFEERYKQMVSECLGSDTGFGIVWLGDEGLAEVGCTVRIAEVLDRMDDGRLNILVEGVRPFRLLRRIDDLPYPAGDIELLDDEPPEPEPERADSVRENYAGLVERATEKRPDPESLAALDAFGMAATIDLEPAFKQELLASRSEEARLAMVESLLEKALARMEQAERVGEAAKSNGKVRI